jgi:hypothetical protein
MKFEQGYYTLKQIEDMIDIHGNGKTHIHCANQENNQLVITIDNNLRIKIRLA